MKWIRFFCAALYSILDGEEVGQVECENHIAPVEFVVVDYSNPSGIGVEFFNQEEGLEEAEFFSLN